MKKIVIVGAGPAGLTAAYELLKKSKQYEVIVLEKMDRVGGISSSVNMNGYIVDTGIHRFFSKSDEVNNIWNEILPLQGKPAYDDIKLKRNKDYSKNGPNPENQDKVMLIKDRITRIYYGKKFYDYPVSLSINTLKNMGFINIIFVGLSYLKSCIFKRKEKSLEDLYINKFGKKLYNMFFKNYTYKVWGVNPSEIASDWGEQRVKGISIKEIIKDIIRKKFKKKNKDNTETSLIETFYYPKLGTIEMWAEMAKKIKEMGGKIYLKANVSKINIKKDKVIDIEYKYNNKIIKEKIDVLISSMPIKELFEDLKGLKAPKYVYDIAINLPYRDFSSVCMVVDKLKLKNNTKVKTLNGVVPDSWIYIQEPHVKLGRVQIFNNWSPYLFKNKEDINNKVLIGLEYFLNENDEYWNMSDDDFINYAKDEAIKIGLIDDCEIEEAIRIKIPKAYPAYFGTYKDFSEVIKYLDKIDNLYCIGRNGQHRYNNMDHSMLTGIETAKCIINGIRNKKDIWNVNTEKEYHEIKTNKNIS